MTKPVPDDQLTREQLMDRLALARCEFKKLREEKNSAEVRAIVANEQRALAQAEAAKLREVVEAIGKDDRLVKVIASAQARLTEAEQLIAAVAKIMNGDQPLANMPDHPLVRTAEVVTADSGTAVSWKRIADRRYALLDELVTQYDAAGGRPQTPEWVRLLASIRTELLEKVIL